MYHSYTCIFQVRLLRFCKRYLVTVLHKTCTLYIDMLDESLSLQFLEAAAETDVSVQCSLLTETLHALMCYVDLCGELDLSVVCNG